MVRRYFICVYIYIWRLSILTCHDLYIYGSISTTWSPCNHCRKRFLSKSCTWKVWYYLIYIYICVCMHVGSNPRIRRLLTLCITSLNEKRFLVGLIIVLHFSMFSESKFAHHILRLLTVISMFEHEFSMRLFNSQEMISKQ